MVNVGRNGLTVGRETLFNLLPALAPAASLAHQPPAHQIDRRFAFVAPSSEDALPNLRFDVLVSGARC
jgi:hypothetical protein